MGIASLVLGIIGLSGLIISGIRITHLLVLISEIEHDSWMSPFNSGGFYYEDKNYPLILDIQDQITTATVFAVVFFLLIILALIFGIKERKKGKENSFYKMATAGFILALIGIILSLPITTRIINVYRLISSSKSGIHIKYLETRPKYTFYNKIGPIRTTTNDTKKYNVIVDLIILCDVNDTETGAELDSRLYELRDFIKSYFAGKSASDLVPENEPQLKLDIVETLNTSFLGAKKIIRVLFNQLDVLEAE
jgi:flagellar FliL protein